MIFYPIREPLLITPDAFEALAALPYPQNEPAAAPPEDGPAYTIDRGLATIDIRGSMFRTVSPYFNSILRLFGLLACDMEKTAAAVREAAADSKVGVILLHVDSPGGSVNGTPELADAVREAAACKQVYAFTPGLACSAAYWVASQADAIYTAPSARLGSIGVLMPLLDTSAALAKSGIVVDVIAAGKYKSTGLAGTSLSEEQRTLLRAQVEETWDTFKKAVTSRRGIAPEDMEGQTFSAAKALEKGFADGLACTLPGLKEKLIARHCI